VSSSEVAEIFAPLLDGEDREPGGEEVCLARLQAATTVEGALDAIRRLAEFPYNDEAERLGRREKVLKAAKACPAELSAPAALVNQFFPLKLLGREAARRTDTHAAGLEDPETWPEEVSGEELLAELESLFRRYVVLPDGGAEVLALWTLFTYSFEAFDTCPLLVLSSPEKRCGKTTAMTLLAHLCRRAVQTSNLTPAVLYRLIEEEHPTVVFDEADAIFGPRRSGDRREELRSILNSGHTRSMAVVWRCEGDSHKPRTFSTWAPKVVALIGRLPDTLEDRSITAPMRRKISTEEVERFRIGRLGSELLPLRRKALRWANDHYDELKDLDPPVPPGLGDREADNWRPLLAIAECAGAEWPKKAREAIAQLKAARPMDDEGSFGVRLLADLREVFEQEGGEKVFTRTILDRLRDREERPWGEWGRARKPITARGISQLLKPYGIRSRDVRIGDDHNKGYSRSDFEDAWSRYLPPSPSVTPRQGPSDGDLSPHSPVTEPRKRHGRQEPEVPENTGNVTVSRVEPRGEPWEKVL